MIRLQHEQIQRVMRFFTNTFPVSSRKGQILGRLATRKPQESHGALLHVDAAWQVTLNWYVFHCFSPVLTKPVSDNLLTFRSIAKKCQENLV